MSVLDRIQKVKDLPWYRKQHSMLVRIASGLVGAVSYSALLFTGNGQAFAICIAIFAVLGAAELYRGVRTQELGEPSDFWGFVACIVFQFAAWTNNGAWFARFLPAILLFLVAATMLTELVKYKPKPIVNVGTTLLGAIYVGWFSSYVTLLHGLTAPVAGMITPFRHTTTGEWLVVFVTTATWFSDIGALFVGRGMGRRKLAPTISPAKTWEGSIGGLVLSLIAGAGFSIALHLPLAHALILAFLCGTAGQVGDLCESVLKRDLGLKDFGTLIPGHGGVLDRIDSFLFSSPLAYYYIVLVLMHK